MAVTVTYNSESLPKIVGAFSLQESYEEIGFSCTFLVESSSASSLTSSCNSIEEKLREPFESLTINFGGGAAYSFSHNDNTCLNSKASFSKSGGDTNTETSRMYSFSFSAGLPADKSGFNFRRRGDFSISKTANGQRVVRFDLEYTASSSPVKNSEENFEEQAETYATSVLSDLFSGVTFDRVEIAKSTDQEKKVTSGSIRYIEIFEAESSVATNDPNLKVVKSSYNIDRGQRIGVSSGGYVVVPMTRISLGYSAEVVKENFATNDLVHQYYLDNIKPFLIQRAIVNLNLENISNTSSSVIVESDSLSIDPVSFSLSGSMSLLAPSSATDIIQLQETIKEELSTGIVFQKLWDGRDFSHSAYHTGSDLVITRVTSVTQLSSAPSFPQIIQDPTLFLIARSRTGAQELMSSNTEVGEQNVKYFTEAFVEVYKKAVVVENLAIPIPNPNPVTFVPGG
jgi:hypothetical protein